MECAAPRKNVIMKTEVLKEVLEAGGNRLILSVLALGIAAVYASAIYAQMGGLHTLHAQGDVYMVVGANSNTAVQVGKDGVLVVDPGPEAEADQLISRKS